MPKKNKSAARKKFNEYVTIADKRVLDTRKSGVELIADDEVFVLVKDTYNYWVSNHGRLINNLRGDFYIHNTNRKRSDSQPTHFTLTVYTDEGKMCKREVFLDKLVAEHFLEQPGDCKRVWHIDRDRNNCFYRNLMWVNYKEYMDLDRGRVRIDEMERHQEFIPYITLKSNVAYSIWNGIYYRCYRMQSKSYEGATMCDLWLNDKELFVEWYNASYYECNGESMAVDKDLLVPGNKEYAPDKCCILPQTINTMLSNCKKHRLSYYKKSKMELPLGVRYSQGMGMYYGEIKPFGYDEVIRLSYWKNPEDAFGEYKKHKQADILIMADKYKSKIPKYIYDALVRYEVQPYNKN